MYGSSQRELRSRERRSSRRSGDANSSKLDFQPLEDRRLLATFAFTEFVDPNPSTGNRFGQVVAPLETGNVIVTSPGDDAGGTDAGAVYLFNGTTGDLISTLTGSTANDQIGSLGVEALAGGNAVVRSPNWSNGSATNAGALTFVNGTTGLSGEVNATNSLVGSAEDDQVGNESLHILQNGNYLAFTPRWDNDGVRDAGAVTFGDRLSGVTGVVGAANSLVGTSEGDSVGASFPLNFDELNESNYLINVPSWDNGSAGNAGAVTFGSGTIGVTGEISAANSLVGSTRNDLIGSNRNGGRVTVLENGNYIVASRDWDNGSEASAGSVTFGDTSIGGAVGVVSAANSLVGSARNDQVGVGGVTVLEGGNYVVSSPFWDNGSVNAAGAYTFGSATAGVEGEITEFNSLVGSSELDGGNTRGGSASVQPLSGGNYAVVTPDWDSETATDVGAVTYGDASVGGAVGVINETISLVGSSTNDNVGSDLVTELTNGNFVVANQWWDNGTLMNAGAVTFVDGAENFRGVVSTSNSLVGSASFDQVGNLSVQPLETGNYLVRSSLWNNGSVQVAGAVTFGDGLTGATGVINEMNSLVGSSTADNIGGDSSNFTFNFNVSGLFLLEGGNYLVISPSWSDGAVANVGAVTFGNGVTGVTGTISSTNSLIGSTESDLVGQFGALLLDGGNYLIRSPFWNNGTASDAGAVTFVDAERGLTGVVSSANSLVGTSTFDRVGEDGFQALDGGNYLILNDRWDNGSSTDAGAVTFVDRNVGVTGAISASNSLVGSSDDDRVGSSLMMLENGNYVVQSAQWDNGAIIDAGAATFGSGVSGAIGVVSSANSLVGTIENDRVGSDVTVLVGGDYVVLTENYSDDSGATGSAVTFGDGEAGVTGVVSLANSLVSIFEPDPRSSISVQPLVGGNYVVNSPFWDNGSATDAGAVTFGDADNGGVAGLVSEVNSLVGTASNDQLGSEGVITLNNGNYIVVSPQWDNGAVIDAGAVTFGDAQNGGAVGEVSPAHSVFGTTSSIATTVLTTDDLGGAFFVTFDGEEENQLFVASQTLGFPPASVDIAARVVSTRIDQGGVSPRPDLLQTLKIVFDRDVSITAEALSLRMIANWGHWLILAH